MTVGEDLTQTRSSTRPKVVEAIEPGWWLLIGITAVVLAVVGLNHFLDFI